MWPKDEIRDVTRTVAKAAAEASWPQTRVILRVILIVLTVAVALWILVKLTAVILLLILSVFFAYLVSPLVDFLRRPIPISGKEQSDAARAGNLVGLSDYRWRYRHRVLCSPARLSNQFPEFAQQARGY